MIEDLPTIREAKVEDVNAICDVHVKSIRELCNSMYTDEEIDAWTGEKRAENYIRAMEQGERLYVAEEDGKIIGFGGIIFKDRVITAVYVHPAYAGRGTGSLILSELESIARNGGLNCLNLYSTLNAVSFYETAGYQREKSERYRLQGDRELECVLMTKNLSPE